MARRWSDPTAFRADPRAAAATKPARTQSVALLAALVLVAGTIATVSYLVEPDRARAFDLLQGSVLIGDQFGPVSMDLPSGKPTLQLLSADAQAGVKPPNTLSVVPLDQGTLLLNNSTGEFNMVDSTGFVAKRTGGVTFAGQSTDTSATGIASGQNAFILRTGSTGTDVLLVSQSTVDTAAVATTSKSVKPRASYETTDQGSTAAGGAANANRSLWALFTSNGTRVIRQLSLAANSSTGDPLKVSAHGSVGKIASVESATANSDGSGSDVVGVVSSDGGSTGTVRVFAPGRAARTASFAAPDGLDTVLPTSNARGRLTYLLHGTDGWSMLGVSTAGAVAGPVTLGTIEPTATLAPPAASLGAIYTVQRSGTSGAVYRIDASAKVTAVTAGYPQRTKDGHSVETASFEDAYLVAQQSRVFVDSPGHYLALTIFTDGSRAPLTVSKTNLTSVNAANGPDALTQGPTTQGSKGRSNTPPPATKPVVAPPQASNKINCKQVNQKPHVPTIDGVVPAARSVSLSWNYPIIASQDCVPTTYVLAFALVSPNAPAAPGKVTIQQHTDSVVTGLFPNTQYRVTVTAYINGLGTTSPPQQFTTGKEGPAAPTALTVAADSSGNWNVSWSGCGSIAQKCVPADSWTVLPTFCDGQQTSSPAPISVPGDPTSIKQAPYVFKGSDATLGRGLQFRVQGQGVDGTQGTVSAASPCVYTNLQPDAGAMTLQASQPPPSQLGGTSTTTVTLDLGDNPIRNVGGVGSKVTLTLNGNGGTQRRTVTVGGPQSTVSAQFTGIRAGATYQASASVTTAHGGLTAQLPSKTVTSSSTWPSGLGIDASCPSSGLLTCQLTVSFHGLSSAAANGERFRLSTNSLISCGGGATQQTLTKNNFDPATDPLTTTLSQLQLFYGPCNVSIVLLEENSSGPLVFGGASSQTLTEGVNLGAPKTSGAGNGDFSASWNGSSAEIVYTGGNALIGLTADHWREVLTHDGNSDVCGTRPSDDNTPTAANPHLVPVNQDCLNKYGGDNSSWTVTIQYDNSIGGGTNTAKVSLNGPVPGYSRCTPTADGFDPEWISPTQVQITYTGDTGVIAGCPSQSWKYTLLDTTGTACGQPNTGGGATQPGATASMVVSCATTPATGWTVRLNYTDPAGAAQPPLVLTIKNDPPS